MRLKILLLVVSYLLIPSPSSAGQVFHARGHYPACEELTYAWDIDHFRELGDREAVQRLFRVGDCAYLPRGSKVELSPVCSTKGPLQPQMVMVRPFRSTDTYWVNRKELR